MTGRVWCPACDGHGRIYGDLCAYCEGATLVEPETERVTR